MPPLDQTGTWTTPPIHIRAEPEPAAGRLADELLQLYVAENRRLVEERTELRTFHDELIALADEQLAAASRERDAARAEIFALRSRLDEMTRMVRRQGALPEAPIPDSLDGLGAWAERHLGDAVELMPRAVAAARKSDFEDVPLVYAALLLMRGTYVPMRRSGSPGLKGCWEKGLRELGLTLSPTHASTRAGEHESKYFVSYDGRRQELDRHLKGSSSRDPRYCFRLYFFWSEEKARVVVGWLPSHLDTRVS